jgi:DNA-binding transcriptional LysR family regulator
VLHQSEIGLKRIIEVSDCIYAYQAAADGLGITPCAMPRAPRFCDAVLADMPPLPPLEVCVVSEEKGVDAALRDLLMQFRLEETAA